MPVSIDASGLRGLPTVIGRAIDDRQNADALAVAAVGAVQTAGLWPVDTGASLSGFYVYSVRDGVVTLGNVQPYAPAVEARTGAAARSLRERQADLEAAWERQFASTLGTYTREYRRAAAHRGREQLLTGRVRGGSASG